MIDLSKEGGADAAQRQASYLEQLLTSEGWRTFLAYAQTQEQKIVSDLAAGSIVEGAIHRLGGQISMIRNLVSWPSVQLAALKGQLSKKFEADKLAKAKQDLTRQTEEAHRG